MGVTDVNLDDAAVGGAVALSIERGVPHKKLVHQNAQGPDVHSLVMFLHRDKAMRGAARAACGSNRYYAGSRHRKELDIARRFFFLFPLVFFFFVWEC